MSEEIKKLYRNPRDKRIAGVCSGIAEYLNVDVTVVRILFLIALLCFGTGLGI
ncbi:MAG: PspC domain-containing protein, partial [Bacteroidales bacterium]|nr:PspC domain-containing protein [Bacteroidales bacterium]